MDGEGHGTPSASTEGTGRGEQRKAAAEQGTGVHEDGDTPESDAGDGGVGEPQPIGRGFFGNIYDQFKGKVKEAFDFLISHKEGDLLGVFHDQELGDIDLVWGSKEENAGLEHILDKHVGEGKDFASADEAMQTIEDVIGNGNKIKDNKDKVIYELDGKRVVVRKNLRDTQTGEMVDENKNWVVTSYDNNTPKSRKESSASTPTTPESNEGDRAVVPDVSGGKGTENPETQEEKQEKNRTNAADIPAHIGEALGELGIDQSQVHVVSDKEQLPKGEGTAYSAIKRGLLVEGWYNPATGDVYLYAPNLKTKERVKQVLLHEMVSHKGLRGLLGQEGFDRLCDEVWKAMGDTDKQRMVAYARYGDETRRMTLDEYARAVADTETRRHAADEYMAHLSEKGIEASVWEKIRNAIVNALRKMGFDIRLSDADIRRLLRESYGALTADESRDALTDGARFSIAPAAQERRLLNDEEKAQAREKLESTTPIAASVGVIKATDNMTARQAAEQWANNNLKKPLEYNTEAGIVVIDKTSIEKSLGHGYGQAKLDAVATLPNGFGNATYLGSLEDFEGQPITNHYFAYPIDYEGELNYVFCRAREDVNTNRLYIHEVFVADKIKSSTLQTAAKLSRSEPHRGTALYRDILSDVLNAKVQQNSEPASEDEENVLFSIRKPFGGNSGYVGYSKSRRAVEAEERGLRNKSQMDSAFADEVNELIQQRNPNAPRVTLKQIKDSLDRVRADEWHHTSMYGNRTNYYSAETIAEYLTPETEEEKNGRTQREAVEHEYHALFREIEREVYNSIPHETIEDPRGLLADGMNVFRTSDNNLVEHTRNVLHPSERIRMIPNGTNTLVDDIDEWTYEHRDEYHRAIDEYNAAKKAAFDQVPQEKKDRVVELRNKLANHVRFSISQANDRFNEELDAFEQGARGEIHLGKPSAELQSIGINATEMFIKPKTLREHLNKHGLTTGDIKDLPMHMRKPFLAYEWGTKAKSMVVITEIPHGNNRITVALKLERNGQRVEVNEIASIHPKEAERLLSEFVDEDENKVHGGLENAIKYIDDKKKVLDWLGLDPPQGSPSLTNRELSVAKIIKDFENPSVSAENNFSDGGTRSFISDNDHAVNTLRGQIETKGMAVHKSQQDLLNHIFDKFGIDVQLEEPDNGTRFSVVSAPSNTIPQRDRNQDREAWKKAFKKHGEKTYDRLHELQGGILATHPMELLEFMRKTIGNENDILHIIENNHDWLIDKFRKDNPKLFATEGAEDIPTIPEVHDLLAQSGYTLLEHTMDNGKAIGVKCMYRDKFEPTGKTDRKHTPNSEYHSRSVICYYGDPSSRLRSQYVFTVTSENADVTPTAYELTEDNMTPEWERYLEKKGRKNADGTFNLKGLKPEREDPFSTSHLMIRIGRGGSHSVEIISRYNHGAFDSNGHYQGVSWQPNSTFGNNLDKLVSGLNQSLMAYKGIEVGKDEIMLSEDVRMADDKRLYRVTDEINGIYFGDGVYIDGNNKAHVVNPSAERLVGRVLINKDGLKLLGEEDAPTIPAHKVTMSANGITFRVGGEEVTEEKDITLPNGEVKHIEKKVWKGDFEYKIEGNDLTTNDVDGDRIDKITNNTKVKSLTDTALQRVGDGFLNSNTQLTSLELPNLQSVGESFLNSNTQLKSLELPALQSVGDWFLRDNKELADKIKEQINNNVRFSINHKQVNDRFNEELQKQIDGTLPKGHIYQLGMPSGILRSAGFPNLPIELSASHLADKAKTSHHPFDIAEIKGLPQALQNPIAVFEYGDKKKAQNAIVELTHNGKNFVVGVHFNQERHGMTISDIRGLYPKDNAEWLNWINQGKALYMDKEKIQALIDQQRRTLADVDYLDLDSVAKIVKKFKNPPLTVENNSDGTRFSISNRNQEIFVSNAARAVEGIKREKATGDNGEVSTASVSTQANPTFSRDGLGAVAQSQLIRFDLVTVFRQSTKTAFPSSVMDFTCECPTIWMTLVLL